MANAHENRHNAWRLLAVTADTRTCVFLQLPSLQLAHAHKYRASHSFPSGTSQLPVNTCTFLVYVCCHSFAYAGTPSLENAHVACDNHDPGCCTSTLLEPFAEHTCASSNFFSPAANTSACSTYNRGIQITTTAT